MDHKSLSVVVKSLDFQLIYDVRMYQNVDLSLYPENRAVCSTLQAQNILFGFFFCQREEIFRHFISLISDSIHGPRDIDQLANLHSVTLRYIVALP